MDESLALGLGVGFVLFFILFYGALLLVGIINYVLQSLGLLKVAKAKDMTRPWLAWIPYANYWLLGAVADKIEAENGNKKNYAKLLVGLLVVSVVIVIVGNILAFSGNAMLYYQPDIATILSLVSIFVNTISIIFSIAASVFFYIALYKVFMHFAPDSAVMYLVLSILLPFALGICLIKCAKAYTPIAVEDVSTEV